MKFVLLMCLCTWATHVSGFTIDRVVLSTNDNPNYIEFWPVVARVWQAMGIRPTLALVADESVTVDESLGDVIRFKPIEGVSTVMYAQAIRLLLPCYFPNDVCLLADIDMFPINRSYFFDMVKDVPDNCFAIYRYEAYTWCPTQFPMCYNAAKGSVFKEIFGITQVKQIPAKIAEWAAAKIGWATDQKMLYKYIHKWSDFETRCVRFSGWPFRRLGRRLVYRRRDIRRKKFIDAALPRPYHDYQHAIDALAKEIIRYA